MKRRDDFLTLLPAVILGGLLPHAGGVSKAVQTATTAMVHSTAMAAPLPLRILNVVLVLTILFCFLKSTGGDAHER